MQPPWHRRICAIRRRLVAFGAPDGRLVAGIDSEDARDMPRQTLPPGWPVRQALPHAQRATSNAADARFLTVCTAPRRKNQLCLPIAATEIRAVLEFHHQRAAWHLHAVVLMPDHLHVLVTVPASTDLRRLMMACKRFIARRTPVQWQRDFFEHRLRRTKHWDAKLEYLRQNPVRAGLVERPEDWPYFWTW
jgi:REP element-mobilizing transposase RayT